MGGVIITIIIFLFLIGVGLYDLLGNGNETYRNKTDGKWIIVTHYLDIFPGINKPMDYSDDRVIIEPDIKTIKSIKCQDCGCIYIPTPNCKPSPSPKYCPECGRKMINWKEIEI